MAAASTPTPTPLNKPLLLLLLLPPLLLCATAPRALAGEVTSPVVINATKDSLTVAPGFACNNNCIVMWQIKGGKNDTWKNYRTPTTNGMVHTISNLEPATRYEIRAFDASQGYTSYTRQDQEEFLQSIPTVVAYTCNGSVPQPQNLTASSIGTDFFVLKWHVSKETCASVDFYFQRGLYRKTYGYLSPTCPPEDLIDMQPSYNCTYIDGNGGAKECTVRISDDIDAGDRYTFGVLGVDANGRCSIPERISVEAKRGNPFGLSVGWWTTILVVLMVFSASTPCIYSYWKRKTGRSLFGDEEAICQSSSSAANGGSENMSETR